MIGQELLSDVAEIFEKQGRLIELPKDKTIVFVGDTHGDREATERVFDRFLNTNHVIVFLGDYVDRGPDSAGNLELILQTKLAYPEAVFLLMGNHEGWAVTTFSPADFWQCLAPKDEQRIASTLSLLPFAAWHPIGVLALHGALPDTDSIEAIQDIKLGSSDWRRITWGDWMDAPGTVLDPGALGRPVYGRDAFETILNRLGFKALVRSHQPHAPTHLYEDRCLTIFTSKAYGGTHRHVALLRSEKAIRTARDLKLVEI